MSLSARPPPITTYGKNTNIYVLVTFYTDSWRRPWGRRCTFNTFWSSDGPFFRHPHRGGLGRYDSPRLTGVSRTLAYGDAGSTHFRAIPGLPLRKPGLHRDRLGVLHLREETRDPAPVGETSSINSGTRDFDGAASALHSETQTPL